METAWGLFAGIAAFVAVALVALARVSAGVTAPAPGDAEAGGRRGYAPATLLVNVALSQGVFASLLVFGAWYAGVPASALGLGADARALPVLVGGVVVGVLLYVADEAMAAVAARLGVAYSETLRESLAPDSTGGWVVLLAVVLPVVAGFEELLFRGVLVGALAVGFGVSPWLLAVGSSLLFGFAHGAQGPGGVAVATTLGFALAAAFVLSGSLFAVVVAHYLVNALEFAVHERSG